jgi:hypothetical protein
LGVISYGLAAAGWLALFLLLLASWRGRLQGGLLLLAVLSTLLWALRAAFYANAEVVEPDWLYQTLEVLRNVMWLVFLAQLLEPLVRGTQVGRWIAVAWAALAIYGMRCWVLSCRASCARVAGVIAGLASGCSDSRPHRFGHCRFGADRTIVS